MKPAAFELFRPTELTEALRLLDELGDDARVLSGGQSLIPMMNLRLAAPTYLIDLSRVPSLSGISGEDGVIRIGAMTRQRELLMDQPLLANVPLIHQAASNIGHVQTRSRGTVGGSLANADPAAELGLTMVTLDAIIVAVGIAGERRVRAREFFIEAMTTALASNEIIVAVEIPDRRNKPRSAFRELARRHGDFALASVAVQHCPASNTYSVGVGAVATTPLYCKHLSMLLASGVANPVQLRDALTCDLTDANPLDDTAASGEYRKSIAIALLGECLDELALQ